MKKFLLISFVFVTLLLIGCDNKLSEAPKFEIYDLEMQRDIGYVLDKTTNVMYISKQNNQSDYTLKITPPTQLDDLSEVMIWCNDIPFTNGEMFYSNGKDIYVTLPKGNRTFTKISIRWKSNSKIEDYFVTYK